MKASNTDSVKIIYSELLIILNEPLSEEHKRDLKACVNKFLIYLISKSLYNKPLSSISQVNIEEFLSEFYSNGEKGKYYLNNYKRLNSVFNNLKRKGYITSNVIEKLVFDGKQIENVSSDKTFFDSHTINKIFNFLKIHDETFYLFAIINYHLMIKSTVIRKLKGNNFNKELTELYIIEGDSKIKYKISDRLNFLLKEMNIDKIGSVNIFTKNDDDYSQSTFFKKWAGLKKKMHQENIIDNESYEVEVFANSMIYDVYQKNGDIYEIQRLLNRSTVYKTKEFLKKLFGDDFENIIIKRN